MGNKDYFSEFSPKCMSFGGAFLSVAITVTIYILLPLAGIAFISGMGASLTDAMDGSIDFGTILDQLAAYLRSLMIYSIPLIVLSAFVGLYEKGSYARIPFKFAYCIYLAAVLLLFTKGGEMDMFIDGSTIGENIHSVAVVLEIKAVIYILAIIAVLKGFLAFAEFSDNRKKYLENSAKRFNKKDKKKAKWIVFEDPVDEESKKKKKSKKGDDE